MEIDALMFRRLVASASGVVYWVGVLVQARRVRRHIGRSPNLKPHGTKERLLWFGWMLVGLMWIVAPWLCGPEERLPGASFIPVLTFPAGVGVGVAAIVAGYAGTLWCYSAMGDTWRIGVNRNEKTSLITNGPYRKIRHPIYSFQLLMLLGVCVLLPSPLFLATLAFHFVCVILKARDEEAYLTSVHGAVYREYTPRTGRLLPRIMRGN